MAKPATLLPREGSIAAKEGLKVAKDATIVAGLWGLCAKERSGVTQEARLIGLQAMSDFKQALSLAKQR